MHILLALLPFLLIITTTTGLPQNAPSPSSSYLSDTTTLPPAICSADSSTAPASPFASDPAWAPSMLSCLSELDNMGWNGYHCLPSNGNGTTIGPSFGFYKGNNGFARYYLDGADCFQQCEACLREGIEKGRAVTTSCTWSPPQQGTKCWMGFNYGG